MLGTIELNRNNIIGADQLITLVSRHAQDSRAMPCYHHLCRMDLSKE